jgi:hypothetical protein
MVNQDTIQYHLIPWDYDDVFNVSPHEIRESRGMGKVFGERHYDSEDDIREETGDRIVYSIEDDLDYIIARDPFLYEKYEKTISAFFGTIDDQYLEVLFDQNHQELSPFYLDEKLVKTSWSDDRRTNMKRWVKNMKDKQSFLEKRVRLIRNKLSID